MIDLTQSTDKLKSSILQDAMQGKLTNQLPEDGNASDLLKSIEDEKQRLIDSGKIKKQKSLPDIDPDEVPFTIPKNWQWVRIGNISMVASASRIHKSDWKRNGIPFYRAREVVRLSKNEPIKDPIFIDYKTYNEKIDSYLKPTIGDLLITGVGTLGTCWIVDDRDFYFKDASVLILKNLYNIDSYFLSKFFDSPLFYSQLSKMAQGTAVKTLTISKTSQLLLPLPPLAEQQRIVTKLNKLLPQVDSFSNSVNQIHNLREQLPTKLRKSFLQSAMQGKLTQQLPEDGNANDLLNSIKIERQRLIDAGKIKKQKALPDIDPDEIPFAIPKNWQWVRLASLGYITSGGTPKRSMESYWKSNDIPWLTPKYLGRNQNTIKLKTVDQYISNLGLEKSSAQLIPKGSIVYSSRAPIGHINIVDFDFTTNQGAKSVSPILINSVFLYYALKQQTSNIRKRAIGTTFKEISGTKFGLSLIPLPPLTEQQRIVAKLDSLFAKLDNLE